jgi:hypothetical protein
MGRRNDMTRRLFAASVAALLGATSLTVSAQSITRRVFVAAEDARGVPVLNMTAADFDIIESGSKREVTRAALGNQPMRVVLMVDSSSAMRAMMSEFRDGLNTFLEALPPQDEVVLVSTGGQLKVRVPPTTDRVKLKSEAARFATDGGANAFVDTLLESDKRFLQLGPGRWPVFVILTTDNGDQREEPRLQRYNLFMNDFLNRGGMAHAVIVAGKQIGSITDVVLNLTENMGGIRKSINLPTSLPDHMKTIAHRLAEDHEIMANRYEVEYSGDAKVLQPVVNVATGREGVTLKMSVRRPF